MSDTFSDGKWTVENLVRGASNIDRWKAETDFIVRKILAIIGESEELEKLLPFGGSELIQIASEHRLSWEMARRRDGKIHIRCLLEMVNTGPALAYSTDPDWTGMQTMGLGGVQTAHNALPIFLRGMLEHSSFPELRERLRPYATAGQT